MRDSYRYQPLDDSQKEIRLMLIEQAQDEQDQVQVILKTISLLDADKLSFSALSYTWGSPDGTSKVLVGGTGESILVTPNLIEALISIRLDMNTQDDAWMWIDAICVNQQDLKERSQQVLHFATIYSKAAKVTAWLGPPDAYSETALDCLENISRHVSYNFDLIEFHAKTDDLSWAVSSMSTIDDLQSTSLINFFHRSWFTRLWVRQEILLGSDRAIIKCGKRTIPWMNLRVAIGYIFNKGHPNRALESFSTGETFRYLYFLHRAINKDLARLLDKGRATQCTDDRDRVYACLSSLHEKVDFYRVNIIPDYSKSVREVYVEVSLAHMKYCGSLRILEHVAAPNEKRSGDCLPSWAPDWSTSNGLRDLHGQAGMRVVHEPFPNSDGTIHARGKIVAKIEQVSPWPDLHGPYKATTQLCMQNMVFASVVEDIRSGNPSVLRQLARVLCTNNFSDRYDGRSDYQPSCAEAEEAVFDTFGASPGDHEALEHGRYRLVWRAIYPICAGRQLILGDDGHLGLAPAHARVGDVIAVFPGCDTAFTLRHTADDCFSVAGSAFYDGSMDGEAFLGPLSATHISLGIGEQVYKSLSTGELQHDPRIPDRFVAETWSKAVVEGTLWEMAMHNLDAMETEGLVTLDAIKLV